MTSLLKHVVELDRLQMLQAASFDSYVAAIHSVAQYAVDVDRPTTERHKQYLAAIEMKVAQASEPETIVATQSALRAELRDYRDTCEGHLRKLQQEFTAALLSLQDVMKSISTSEVFHEKQLTEELRNLEVLTDRGTYEDLKAGVKSSVKTIKAYVEDLRKRNELTISQFKDEIRVLQTRLRDTEAAAAKDETTGALNRKEFEARVRRDILHDLSLSLEIIRVPNYPEIRSRHGQYLAAKAMMSLYGRLRNYLGEDAEIGRWSEDTMTVKLVGGNQPAMKILKDLAAKLPGSYVCVEDGHAVTLYLRTCMCLAQYEGSETGDQFLNKVDAMCKSLA